MPCSLCKGSSFKHFFLCRILESFQIFKMQVHNLHKNIFLTFSQLKGVIEMKSNVFLVGDFLIAVSLLVACSP